MIVNVKKIFSNITSKTTDIRKWRLDLVDYIRIQYTLENSVTKYN